MGVTAGNTVTESDLLAAAVIEVGDELIQSENSSRGSGGEVVRRFTSDSWSFSSRILFP